MKLNENTNVAMPIKNMVGIIIAVAMGVLAWSNITARLTSLETSRELMNADLLKKSEQTTTDQEQFLLLESLFKDVENLQNTQEQLKKALEDIEKLKDKVRENGKGSYQ